MSDVEADEFLKESVANRRALQAARLGVPEFVEPERPFVTTHGKKPTSIIFDPSDGRIPYLSPDLQRPKADQLNAPEDIPLSERCLRALEAVPIFPNTGLLYLQIAQSHDAIVFLH